MIGVVSLLVLGSASLPLTPAPEKLQPWTTALREQQPDHAFAAVYRTGSHHLVFVAAEHENQNDSATFKMIRAAYAAHTFNTVIAEGFPTSWGVNPARILDYVAKDITGANGFVEGGETVPTVLGARRQSAAVIGGEADDVDTRMRVIADGFSTTDLLGFYVLRDIPQWIRERELSDAGDPRLAAKIVASLAHNRQRLDLPADVLPNFAEWAAWYQRLNHKPIGTGFVTEEVGPLADGRFGTNRIAYGVSRARDAYLHDLIIAHLNAGEDVLVVFGGSHLMIQRPALDAVLGLPCYIGDLLTQAVTACR